MSDQLTALFREYISKTATPARQEELMALLRDPEQAAAIHALIAAEMEEGEITHKLNQEQADAIFQQVLHAQPVPIHRSRPVFRWVAAAAVIALLSTATWLLTTHRFSAGGEQAAVRHNIVPGSMGAILTLANGQQLVLDSLGNGVIANESGTQVILKNGQVAYDAKGDAALMAASNTMATPRGRQFQLVLPDGTKVWLNSASSLQYPTAFTGKDRQVTLSGEAYFEVAANSKQPFIVKTRAIGLTVLGTSFNVMAYEDEPTTRATLITGSVRVAEQAAAGNASVVLHEGEQADASLTITRPNIEEVLAWKQGKFYFDGMPIRDIMRTIARWYDVDIVYEGPSPIAQFSGVLPRRQEVADLLRALEKTGDMHFRIEGRKIIVTR